MIDKAEANSILQDAISLAYAKLSDHDRALVDQQAERLTVLGIDLRDARYLLVMLSNGRDVRDVLRETTSEAMK